MTDMTYLYAERVRTEIRDHVAHVTLIRGDKMNAVDPAMAEAIVTAGEALVGRKDIRAVVLSGEGRAFCAGLDTASFEELANTNPEARVMARSHGDCNIYQRICMVWREVPVPVIAAVQGVAFGAGLQLALGADIRIANPETQMAVMEAKWGLVPDMGGMVLLPQLVRSDVLRLMTYTAEPVGAEQALVWGLITQIADDPLAAAQALARKIAGKSPSGTRAAKRLIGFAEGPVSAAEVLMEESREQVPLIGGRDQREIIAANMQKRKPEFT